MRGGYFYDLRDTPQQGRKGIFMAKILKKEALADKVFRYRLDAPRIAKKQRPGQFIILRPVQNSERIPLTIADADVKGGWIDIIFQVVGRTTMLLSMLNEGDSILDLVGPFGQPTHIKKFGRCLCIGGGVGIAPLYPITRGLREAGQQRHLNHRCPDPEPPHFAGRIRIGFPRAACHDRRRHFGAKGNCIECFQGALRQGGQIRCRLCHRAGHDDEGDIAASPLRRASKPMSP